MPLPRTLSGLALCSILIASCADVPDTRGGVDLGVHVQWLTGDPAGTLAEDVTQLRVMLWENGEGPLETVRTPMSLDVSEGRVLLSDPLLNGLPTDVPILVRVEASTSAGLKYVGQIGPLELAPGERRYVELRMYEIGVSTAPDLNGMSARFLHSATRLPDGRVLIAGGFTSVDSSADCPAGVAVEAQCFEVTASADAWVFDPATGRFFPVSGGMKQARAGHTATSLPGGRVLIAGGAEHATLVFSPIDPGGMTRTHDFSIFAAPSESLTTFEIFEPDQGAETLDADRDGDPGRGGFTGAADDPDMPGRLNDPRFMHAAASVPGHAGQVLLVGGLGGDGAAGRWEVFDEGRAGGYGVYANATNVLGARRTMPGAVALTDAVWILGGSMAMGDSDLAEIWSPDGGNGAVTPATDTTFPASNPMATGAHPEFSLLRPSTAALNDGSEALVVGWFGPRCNAGTIDPLFAMTPDGSMTVPCGHSGGPSRNFTVSGADGATVPLDTGSPHAFGSVAMLEDGEVAISGGIANIGWTPQASIEVFTGVVIDGMAELSPRRYSLRTQRAFHTTTALPNLGLLSVGGFRLSSDATAMTLVGAVEVHYLDRGPTPMMGR